MNFLKLARALLEEVPESSNSGLSSHKKIFFETPFKVGYMKILHLVQISDA